MATLAAVGNLGLSTLRARRQSHEDACGCNALCSTIRPSLVAARAQKSTLGAGATGRPTFGTWHYERKDIGDCDTRRHWHPTESSSLDDKYAKAVPTAGPGSSHPTTTHKKHSTCDALGRHLWDCDGTKYLLGARCSVANAVGRRCAMISLGDADNNANYVSEATCAQYYSILARCMTAHAYVGCPGVRIWAESKWIRAVKPS
eukprot:7757884-Alexandrium_andersonii.AAC.1